MHSNGTHTYNPEQPSLIVLQARVTPHQLTPGQVDVQVSDLKAQNLPGGWHAVHELLLDAAKAAHKQAMQEMQAQKPLVEVAQEMPK